MAFQSAFHCCGAASATFDGTSAARSADAGGAAVAFESGAGADDADAIASLPGVDCLWIGHMDLSCALGAPGQFDTPQFQKAVDKVLTAAWHHRKRAGRLARNAEEGIALARAGFDCLALGTDTNVYQTALAHGIGKLREGLVERGS